LYSAIEPIAPDKTPDLWRKGSPPLNQEQMYIFGISEPFGEGRDRSDVILVWVTSANHQKKSLPDWNDGGRCAFGVGFVDGPERWRFPIECHAEPLSARRIDTESVICTILTHGQYSVGSSNGAADGGRPERLCKRA
jgi:hypothetical protein